jgi:hypothetical protein
VGDADEDIDAPEAGAVRSPMRHENSISWCQGAATPFFSNYGRAHCSMTPIFETQQKQGATEKKLKKVGIATKLFGKSIVINSNALVEAWAKFLRP